MRGLAAAGGLAGVLSGGLALAARAIDGPLAVALAPLRAMRAGTAIALAALGLAVLARARGAGRPVAYAGAVVAMSLAMVSVLARALHDTAPHPFWMPPQAALTLALLGAAAATREGRGLRALVSSQLMVVAAVLVAFVALLGHILDARVLHQLASLGSFIGGAVLGTVGIGIGILALDGDRGVLGALRAPDVSGALLRLMVPAALLLPVLTHLGVAAAERARLWRDPNLGPAVASTVLALGLVALAAWAARRFAAYERRRGAADEDARRSRADLEHRVSTRTLELERTSRALTEQLARNAATQEELRASERRLRAILDHASYAILTTGPDGVIREFNPAAEQMLGWDREEVVGRLTPLAFHDLGKLQRSGAALSAALERSGAPALDSVALGSRPGIVDELESTFVARDGTRFPVWLSISALRDERGTLTGHLVIASDITHEKAARDALVRAKNEAEAAMRARADFLARMSHEIRTPLNGVIGMNELALQTKLTHEQRHYLETVRSSADALLALVDDILDFSRMDAGKLRLEQIPFSLRELIADTLRPLAPRADDKGLELIGDVPPEVPDRFVGDPHRVRQVITNLVANAMKFTDRGEIVVRVDATRDVDDHAELELHVVDTGIGVPHEKQQRIFEAFAQGDESISRRYGGVGLGLAICAQLAQLMGGRVSLRSERGVGSDFWMTVRLRRADEALGARAPSPALLGMRALIADPNETSSRVLRDLLGSWGMRPEIVAPGRVVELVRASLRGESPVRVVLLEARDGATSSITRALARTHGNEVAVLVLTPAGASSREPGDGVVPVLKPVSASALLEAVEASAIAERITQEMDVRGMWPEHGVERPLNVLIAEDNGVNRALITKILEKAGHTAVAVDDGRKALSALARERFDVVLMDVQMPEMDGLEAVRTLRASERESGARVPVVALTAQAMSGDRERCLEAGMDDYLSKPVDPDRVLETIARLARERPAATGVALPARRELAPRARADAELLDELRGVFVEEVASTMRRMRHAVAAGDRALVSRLAHSLKGAALTMRASALVEAARALEMDEASADDRALSSLFEALEQAARLDACAPTEESAA